MMTKNTILLTLIAGLFLAASCKRHMYDDSETVLAKTGENYLYLSDLEPNIPANISGSDSIQLVNNMINNWVKQEIILQYANKNLPDSLKDFSEQLKSYENNLLIYEYKKRYVEQRMDTVVSSIELENYYNDHLHEFQLKENIVQFVFIKIPAQSQMVEEARKLIKNINDTAIDRTMVRDFCDKNAVDFYLNDEHWISFNELVKQVPIDAFNQEIYLQNNKFIEIKDHPYWYFVHLKDFKIKEDVSPFDFQKERIKSIILNKRKIDLLNSLEEDIYQNATDNNHFEIY
jgi:hypothetical protein